VLSSKFADIFRGNSGKQGLIAGEITDADTEKLWAALEADPGSSITINLVDQTATIGDLSVHFDIDEYTKWRLLEGLDDIGLTLRDEQAITDFEAKRPSWMPKTLPAKH
jgi:3-isopropylmalate/(R)-2-methylmalate dehydratase small subunit